MSFASLNKARIKHMAENGNKRAVLVLKLHDRFEELISTLLICSNGAYVASATVSTLLFVQLLGESGPFVSGIVITVISVIFTDDLPKSMGKQAPEKFALMTAPIVLLTITILKPANFILVSCKNFINNRLFSGKNENSSEDFGGFRGEELLYVVEEAEQDGTITEEDSVRISNAIEFNDLVIEDILTPRVNIVGISKEFTTEDIANIFLETGYSRLPVYEENIDNIIGEIHIRDFLKCTVNKDTTLDDIMSPVLYTASVTQAPELFKLLQKEQKHMAIVADEYGGTEGLVTIDDILKQLVGDIMDENDEITEDFKQIEENKHKVSCAADIYKMFEYFNMDEECDSLSVGGWIIDNLERIPKKGETFTYKNLTVTVTRATPKKVEECIIDVLPEIATEIREDNDVG